MYFIAVDFQLIGNRIFIKSLAANFNPSDRIIKNTQNLANFDPLSPNLWSG